MWSKIEEDDELYVDACHGLEITQPKGAGRLKE